VQYWVRAQAWLAAPLQLLNDSLLCVFCLLQYKFKLQPAQCQSGKSCAPLTFTSNSATPSFPGLTPSTTVSTCWPTVADPPCVVPNADHMVVPGPEQLC
jgi:hypothetical protein